MNNYESYFEDIKDRSIRISELIEQIIQLEDLIAMHRKFGSKGLAIEQYINRKQEFGDTLNQFLMPHSMKVVSVEAKTL